MLNVGGGVLIAAAGVVGGADRYVMRSPYGIGWGVGSALGVVQEDVVPEDRHLPPFGDGKGAFWEVLLDIGSGMSPFPLPHGSIGGCTCPILVFPDWNTPSSWRLINVLGAFHPVCASKHPVCAPEGSLSSALVRQMTPPGVPSPVW